METIFYYGGDEIQALMFVDQSCSLHCGCIGGVGHNRSIFIPIDQILTAAAVVRDFIPGKQWTRSLSTVLRYFYHTRGFLKRSLPLN
ncbi:480bb34c-3f51-49d5-a7c8-b8e3ef20ba47 [Sclerotinia trifoliorum]|uniref:480bb34c-3f51-49d5-a7c8-b8e3ef20ba47 n=1 Tax=Sclerotinia trifoliorum TaxID=28548 RepID=A0A8H2ZVD0_9HELO|nr:480bb34c-3f51-49d5-a7c8-b8e3ef20ba47 [Sclerotinia trifoliorum]